ncbi:MAG: hypothetical protein ABSE44_12600 [Candidatus Sulfotelmatobacter sp.]|jgi:hypothetical protein
MRERVHLRTLMSFQVHKKGSAVGGISEPSIQLTGCNVWNKA